MVANSGEKMIKQPTEKLNWTNDPRNFSEEISDKLYSKIESNQIYKPLKSYIITVEEDTRYLMAGRLLQTFLSLSKVDISSATSKCLKNEQVMMALVIIQRYGNIFQT